MTNDLSPNRIVRWLSRVLAVVLVLAIALAAFPQTGRAAVHQATCAKSYTVKAGDTLTSIAAQFSVTVQELADLNGLKPPYLIVIGQVLCLPASAKTTSTTTSGSTSTTKFTYDVAVKQVGKRIQVNVSGFPARSNYRVRVGASLRFRDDWVIVGKIRTNKSGAGEAFYGLPKDLRDRPYYFMCFKNMVTDTLHCKKIVQKVAK